MTGDRAQFWIKKIKGSRVNLLMLECYSDACVVTLCGSVRREAEFCRYSEVASTNDRQTFDVS